MLASVSHLWARSSGSSSGLHGCAAPTVKSEPEIGWEAYTLVNTPLPYTASITPLPTFALHFRGGLHSPSKHPFAIHCCHYTVSHPLLLSSYTHLQSPSGCCFCWFHPQTPPNIDRQCPSSKYQKIVILILLSDTLYLVMTCIIFHLTIQIERWQCCLSSTPVHLLPAPDSSFRATPF